MAMTDHGVLRGWGGHDLVDRDGVKAGSIVDLYIDEQTKQPTWALVCTGLLGSRQTLVPLAQATVPLAVLGQGCVAVTSGDGCSPGSSGRGCDTGVSSVPVVGSGLRRPR
jgi:hypothetical protein